MFGDSQRFSGASVGAHSKRPTPLSEPNKSLKLRMWWVAEPPNLEKYLAGMRKYPLFATSLFPITPSRQWVF
jgi:hypothetical protein